MTKHQPVRRPVTKHPTGEVTVTSDVPLLAIRDLTVAFHTRDREVTAVRGLSRPAASSRPAAPTTCSPTPTTPYTRDLLTAIPAGGYALPRAAHL
jgi:hypothetical protein